MTNLKHHPKTAFEQACEDDIAWQMEAMLDRERRRTTDEADGFYQPKEDEEDE